MTRAMQVVMKLVRVASNRHVRNWEAPDALVQEIIPVASRTDSGQSCAVATQRKPVNKIAPPNATRATARLTRERCRPISKIVVTFAN